MLKQIVPEVLVHQSEFCQSNAVVVQGKSGVLLIDPGITTAEMAHIADDLRGGDSTVVAGFSTHPHWDHLLWHSRFGSVPRYATADCAAAIGSVLSQPNWKDRVAGMLPPDFANQIPIDELFGQINGLAAKATQLTWDGPTVRIIEHQAHAAGHAALLVEDQHVLIAGDMLSDVLIPILNLNAANPIQDYLTALKLLESLIDNVDIIIPGHGSVADADQLRARIDQDRAYVHALRDHKAPNDPRLGPSATYDWVRGVHERQLLQLSKPVELI